MASLAVVICLLLMVIYHTQYGSVSGAITDISPSGVILSGGIDMTVTGSDLNAGTAAPKIVITATYVAASFTFTGEDCTVVTATSLTCPSPVIDSSSITGYTLPSAATQRLLNDNGTLDFTVSVTWSSGTEDFGSVNVYKDPGVTMKDAIRTFTVWTNTIIFFFGVDLNGYISDMSDYTFSVGNLDCPVTYVNSTWMSCSIPTTIPERDNVEDTSPVVMTIGNYQEQMGTLHYRVPVFFDATDTFELYDPTDRANRVTVEGHYLMVGLNHSSYRVQIGRGECSDIVVSTTSLSCIPPPTAPVPLADWPLKGELPQMVITVPKDSNDAVFQYVYHVTYIKYGNTTNENAPGLPSDGQATVAPSGDTEGDDTNSESERGGSGNDASDNWKWIVVGICAFVGAAFLVILFSCLCCSDICPIGKHRMNWVEKKPFYKIESDSARTPRSSVRSYQTRTSSSIYPTPSHLYYLTQQQQRY